MTTVTEELLREIGETAAARLREWKLEQPSIDHIEDCATTIDGSWTIEQAAACVASLVEAGRALNLKNPGDKAFMTVLARLFAKRSTPAAVAAYALLLPFMEAGYAPSDNALVFACEMTMVLMGAEVEALIRGSRKGQDQSA
jgi:hypothetical protein